MWTSFIGFMASGKSAMIDLLHQGTRLTAVDLDKVVAERAGCSLPEIFHRGGVDQFRALEREALAALAPDQSLLLATGGGCVEVPQNAELLRERGVVIWLDASWAVLRLRIEQEGAERRPLVAHLGWDGLQRLYTHRRRVYARTAHFRLRTDRVPLGVTARNAMLRSLWWKRRREGSPP